MPDPRLIKTPDGLIHAFPADATDDEISTALNAPPPSARGATKQKSWTDYAVESLPTAGGTVGGVIGGIYGAVPGAIGGATLGGAAGEAFKQLINRARGAEAPSTPLEAATKIGTQGAIQGGSELAGQGLMKGAQMAAHGLMDFAIRPAPTVAEEFGDIAGTAIKERLPVGSVIPGATKGSQLARAARTEAAKETRATLTEAGQRGVNFSARDVASGPVTKMVSDIAKQPLSESELHHVSRLFEQYLSEHPDRLSPNALKDMKQASQRIAKPILRAINQGNVPAAGESLKAQFNAAIAEGSKEALETIPKVAEQEARTQSLIGATKAIRRAESRRLPLVAELAAPIAGGVIGGVRGGDARGVGEGITAATLTRALLSPRTTSRAALGLTAPAIQQALRQMPRASVYALLGDLEKQVSKEQ